METTRDPADVDGTPPPPAGDGAWSYVRGVMPAVVSWLVLAGLVAFLLLGVATRGRDTDEAALREWLDETRVFRKTIGQLAREYAASGDSVVREEIGEQLRAMAEPARMFPARLPLFPVIYRFEVSFRSRNEKVIWESYLPRPAGNLPDEGRLRQLKHDLTREKDQSVILLMDYTLHTAGSVQEEQEHRRAVLLTFGGLSLLSGLLAVGWGVVAFRREQGREWHRLQALAAADHARLEAARARLEKQEVERAAELSRLEMQSQIAAGISIMAGSYAHNIKNLLVRPDDLLVRCIESNKVPAEQVPMLQEVRTTIGTVTERLQQILHTVRRDPNEAKFTRIDLNELLADLRKTWSDVARDSWKMDLTVVPAPSPAWVDGDVSHLQQVIENLLMNARDATRMMRNHLRKAAGADPTFDQAARRQALIKAAGWKGEVRVGLRHEDGKVVLEVVDNGVGMTEEVRQKCLNPRFSTKQGAEYAGLGAGSGLGLAFVAAVLRHHKAALEIESEPQQGATFRVSFPAAPAPIPQPL